MPERGWSRAGAQAHGRRAWQAAEVPTWKRRHGWRALRAAMPGVPRLPAARLMLWPRTDLLQVQAWMGRRPRCQRHVPSLSLSTDPPTLSQEFPP